MKDAQKPDHISLSTLIGRLKDGRFVIPDFQREFEWQPWDIRDLMRSIFDDHRRLRPEAKPVDRLHQPPGLRDRGRAGWTMLRPRPATRSSWHPAATGGWPGSCAWRSCPGPIVEHPTVGKQFLSETVVVRTGHGSSFGGVRTARQAWNADCCAIGHCPVLSGETPHAHGGVRPTPGRSREKLGLGQSRVLSRVHLAPGMAPVACSTCSN
jgi:hypothetical protein